MGIYKLQVHSVAIAIFVACVIEILLVVVTSVRPGTDGAVGAPIPTWYIDLSHNFLDFFPEPSFKEQATEWLIFLIDIMLTAIPIYLFSLFLGTKKALISTVGGFIIVLGLAWGMHSINLPIGIPLPIADAQIKHSRPLALWIDWLVFTSFLTFIFSRFRK